MKRFEYKELICDITGDVVSKLDELGSDGWELICVVPYPRNDHVYYFKREIEGEKSESK